MSNARCLIVEDEAVAQRILESYLADLPEFELVGKCPNALEARTFLQEHPVDLMFLDIEMPRLKGLSFLKTLSDPPEVIITTAHREYALEGFELQVLDYLLKPISFERFLQAMDRYRKVTTVMFSDTPPDESLVPLEFLYVKSDRKTVKLRPAEINYIEGMNNYIQIRCRDGQTHIVYSSLQDFQARLDQRFVRIHKSFVVNRDHITSFSKELVDIAGRSLPVGRVYRGVVEKL